MVLRYGFTPPARIDLTNPPMAVLMMGTTPEIQEALQFAESSGMTGGFSAPNDTLYFRYVRWSLDSLLATVYSVISVAPNAYWQNSKLDKDTEWKTLYAPQKGGVIIDVLRKDIVSQGHGKKADITFKE